MRRLLGVTVALALAGVVVGGCGGSASPTGTAKATANGVVFPTGKWAGTAGDIAYVMEFRSDGTWTMSWRGPDDSEGKNEGTYTTDKDTLTFVTDAICKEQGFEERGTYTWRLADDMLMLMVKKDGCPDRVAGLDLEAMTPVE